MYQKLIFKATKAAKIRFNSSKNKNKKVEKS